MRKEIIKKLIHDPESWTFSKFTVKHKSGIEIWTANGMAYLSIYAPVKYKFGFFEKLDIWSAIKFCKKSQLLKLIQS